MAEQNNHIKELATEETEFRKGLGLFDSTMLVAGSMIGSGIFFTPGIIAKYLPYPSLIIVVWLICGVLTILGALSYAELAASMPRAGGQYVYLREAYGPFPAFLFGWTLFLVIQTGTIAAVAAAFGLCLDRMFGIGSFHLVETAPFTIHLFLYSHTFGSFVIDGVKLAAVACIVFLTATNYTGIRSGAIVQNIFTTLKIGALAALIILGFTLGKGSSANFAPGFPASFDTGILSAFGLAMISSLWAYDAWFNVTFTSEEVKDPKKTLPLSLILGTALVMAVYCLANVVYHYVLPLSSVQASKLVGADAAIAILGPIGGQLINIAILISTFGCVNGILLAGPRAYYAMAKDGVFFKKLSYVHPSFKTPSFALIVQCVWTCILALSGTFENLFTYVIFAAWIFYAMTVLSVFILRKKYPNLERPYKVWGYPVVPVIYLIVALWFVINTLYTKRLESGIGLMIVLLGIPAYFYWMKKN